MSVHLNSGELDTVLKALPPGSSREYVERLCSRVTTAGRDTKDDEISANAAAYDALVALITSMSRHTSFGRNIVRARAADRDGRVHFVALLRLVIETLDNCSLMWWKHILTGFARIGLNRDRVSQEKEEEIVRQYGERNAAGEEIAQRVKILLRGRTLDDPSLRLSNMEELWTVLMHCVALYTTSRPSHILIAGRRPELKPWQPNPTPAQLCPPSIGAFLAEKVGGGSAAIDPVEFCSCRGAYLALRSNGGLRDGRGQLKMMQDPTLMTQLLLMNHPMSEALLENASEAFLRLYLEHRSSIETDTGCGSHPTVLSFLCTDDEGKLNQDKWDHVCGLAASSDTSLGPPFTNATKSVLVSALTLRTGGEPLAVSWTQDGLAEPDDFASRGQWSRLHGNKIKESLLATGLFCEEEESEHRDSVDVERLAAALDLLASTTWFLKQTASSFHPLPRIRHHALTILLEGMKHDRNRFRPYWRSVLGMSGPPTVCDGGFQGNILDANCGSCGMPADLCPSIVRLRAELSEWAALDPAHHAGAKAASVRDLARMVDRFQGTVPDKDNWACDPILHNAAEYFLQSGLVVVDGGGAVPWHFTEPRTVAWTDRGPEVEGRRKLA